MDENDQIVGHVNKYLSHRFVPGTPRGVLHRAFSVFLFDEDGKLLLQKAREKEQILEYSHDMIRLNYFLLKWLRFLFSTSGVPEMPFILVICTGTTIFNLGSR